MSETIVKESIASAKELIRHYYECDIPSFLSGPPGVGKSAIYAQLAEEKKIGFIDIRLSTKDPVDLMGLPHVHNNETTWARPEFWPKEGRDAERGILLFDEMADSNRAMQTAAYQVILDRRIGPHILPKGWYPCAAGNTREHHAGAQSLSTALANRFAHIDVGVNSQAWLEWANMNGISPLVIGFISVRPQLLHDMKGSDLRAFATPRSWAQASKVAEVAPPLRFKLMAGLVGGGPAGEFEAVMREVNLPTVEEVVSSPNKCMIPKEPAGKYALSSLLSHNATKDNFDRMYTYTNRKEFGRDFHICFVTTACRRDTALCDTKTFTQFVEETSDIMI